MDTAHIVAYRRIFLGGHRALCGTLMRHSTPGIDKGARACPKCVRIHQRATRKEAQR